MTTFGEINEPSSRTAWEDWDEVLFTENYIELVYHQYFNSALLY